ncbi:MAG: hypothetical protein ACT4PJ_11830 [Gemmatimonadaceae bacterium]
MPFTFDPPPNEGALRQGEILGEVWVHQPLAPATAIQADGPLVASTNHRFMVVLHADCDLLQDYNERDRARKAGAAVDQSHPSLVPQVLLCDAYEESHARSRVGASDLWRRIRQNQDERYHHIQSAAIANVQGPAFPPLILDFRRTFAIFTEALYAPLETGEIHRLSLIPPVYLHDLMHRFFGYHSRVGLPD